MQKKPQNYRYANIDGQVIAVLPQAKFVFQCKRGFYHFKDRKPEVVRWGKNHEWTEIKELLQYRDENGHIKLYRTPAVDNWKSRIFMTSEEKPKETEREIIYCDIA